MADGILIKTYALHHKGDHELDFQPIRDKLRSDPEFHGLITLAEPPSTRVLYMIVKIDNPEGFTGGDTESTTTYHLGLESNRAFETAWAGKESIPLTFVRYDKIVTEFLPFGP